MCVKKCKKNKGKNGKKSSFCTGSVVGLEKAKKHLIPISQQQNTSIYIIELFGVNQNKTQVQ